MGPRCILTLAVAVAVGCKGKSPADWHPGIKEFTDGISQSQPASTAPFRIVADLAGSDEDPVLQFNITNVSSSPQMLDEADFPWTECPGPPVTGITLSGTVLPVLPRIQTCLRGEPRPVEIPPGGDLPGRLPLRAVFSTHVPRDTDVLLLWGYSAGAHFYNGLVQLPARRQHDGTPN